MVNVNYHGWVEINILPLLTRWLKKPSKNYGLEVKVEDGEGNPVTWSDVFQVPHINCSDPAYGW